MNAECVDRRNSINDMLCDMLSYEFDKLQEVNVNLSEDEKIADFFIGLFPKINDPEDLSLEICTFLEDLQVHAKAKNNKVVVDFCNFFADNAEQFAKDLLTLKPTIAEKIRKAMLV